LPKRGRRLTGSWQEMLKRGLKGLEKLGGIPGSIGGALVMNAGAFGQAVSDCLVSIDYLDFTDMQIRTLSAAGLEAGYRTSVLRIKKPSFYRHNSGFPKTQAARQKMFLMKSSRNGRQNIRWTFQLRIGFQKSPRYARKRPYRTVRA